MSNRAGSMATIDLALQPPPAHAAQPKEVPTPGDDHTPATAKGPGDIAPIAPPPLPEELLKAGKKDEPEETPAPADRTGEQVNAITGAARSTFETKHPFGLDFFKLHNLAVDVESIPTPGSFMFPLLCLIVAFFALIPVNGHTRLMWLMLVITGNAVTAGDLIGGGGTGGTGGATQQGGAILQPPPTSMTPMPYGGTLVEGA